MNARKLVIAVGTATAAGALSATLAFAAEVSATASGGSQPSASYGASADGAGSNGSAGGNGGGLSVRLPPLPSVPDVDSIIPAAQSRAAAPPHPVKSETGKGEAAP